MHLGNQMITPACAVYAAAAAGAGLCVGVAIARRQKLAHPWRLASATAMVFAAQAFNIPVLPAVSGHLVGTFLLAHWFGSVWGAAAMALILTVQSLLLGDGGWMALGANVLNMAILPALVVYPLWTRCFGRGLGSVATGAWASVVIAALAASIELMSQPAARATAMPLLVSMIGVHAAIGLLEATLTMAGVLLARRFDNARASAVMACASLAVLVAATFGSSPWPDGLEYSLALHGLSDLIGAGGSESLVLAMLGCAIVALGAAAIPLLSRAGAVRVTVHHEGSAAQCR
ncbi:MAG TPA: energy-coupling factor ABC transporter permease [Tepidisphaeraceae bacterium]|nr:energy-coupling factor ABC transporter permease [Tepidisphaeraceae bacterium]